MTEAIAAKAVDVAAKSAGGVLDKLLGPTAEIMGQQLANKYRKQNANRVINKASRRVDLTEEGCVPPRVAVDVLDKAQWADNEFLAEYLSGVLASARTSEGDTDSAISWSALVGRLSSDQLALHWAIYSGFQWTVRGEGPERLWSWSSAQMVVGYPALLSALGWPLDQSGLQRLMEAAYVLKHEGLLGDLTHGDGEHLGKQVTWTKGKHFASDYDHLAFKVTVTGIGLLMRAVGNNGIWFGEVSGKAVSDALDATETLPAAPAIVFVSSLPDLDNDVEATT